MNRIKKLEQFTKSKSELNRLENQTKQLDDKAFNEFLKKKRMGSWENG